MDESTPQPNIQIDLDPEIAQGKYCNIAISNYSHEEFILDFAFLQPQLQKANIRSRIVLTPGNTKKLMQLLSHQVGDYEEKFGPISDDNSNNNAIKMSFN